MLGLFCLYVFNTPLNNGETDVTKEDTSQRIFSSYVKLKQDSFLYEKVDETYRQSNKVKQHSKLILQDAQDDAKEYYKLKDSDLFVLIREVEACEAFAWDESYSRYIAFNENVVAPANTSFYDQDGNLKYQNLKEEQFPIYRKTQSKYYILYHNEYLQVDKDQVDVIEVENTQASNATSIPVFMYHFFYDENLKEQASDGNFMEIHNFEDQLVGAKNAGYQSITMSDLNLYLDGEVQLHQKSFLITMDDNAQSVKRLAYPVLEKTQTYATSFVITSWVEDVGALKSHYIELQSHSDSLHTGGCEEQHGGSMLCIDTPKGVEDLTTSSNKLDGAFVLAYPFGDFNDHTKEILSLAKYRLAFTTQNGRVQLGMDKFELPRVRISTQVDATTFLRLLEE